MSITSSLHQSSCTNYFMVSSSLFMETNVTFCREGHKKPSIYSTFLSSAIWVLLGFANTVRLETKTWIRSVTHPGHLVPVSNSSLPSVRWASCSMLQIEDTGSQRWLIILLSLSSCCCLLLRWELSTHKAKLRQRLGEEVNGTRRMRYYPVVSLKNYTK